MGKRSDFPRRANDAYDTWDVRALRPLLSLVGPGSFVEPCAGKGDLVDQLEAAGLPCALAFDVEPRRFDIEYGDAMTAQLPPGSRVITNPPWSRPLLHAIIENFAPQCETWLLFDSDWPFTQRAQKPLRWCHAILPIGRLRWIPGSKWDAQDNVAWYLFGPDPPTAPILLPRY